MIKLKDILKENSPGFKDRQFGDPLPTVDDIAKNYQNKNKQSVNEARGYHPELKIPSDVSYYERDWVAVFKEWGNKDYGPRESDMYDWNDQKHYENVKKEFNAHMKKIATKLNAASKPLAEVWREWDKILYKHRAKDEK